MTNTNYAWPNLDRPGEPLNPTQTGPHALIDGKGKAVWAWWTALQTGSSWMLANHNGLQTGPEGIVQHGFGYLGPAALPK